jgi:hypothetical protein
MKRRSKEAVPAEVPVLPDLEHAKNAVLNTLESLQSRRSYEHAMAEFVEWYCSAARLAFNRTVVLQYRMFLEKKQLAPATINVRLAAVRRLAYEAADSGVLSPDVVAGIRRVKGVRQIGQRLGNWLCLDQGKIFSWQCHRRRFAESETRPCCPFYWGVVCGAQKWSHWNANGFSNGRAIGQ